MVVRFCRTRAATALSPREVANFQRYLLELLTEGRSPSAQHSSIDWNAIAAACEIDPQIMEQAAQTLSPVLEALSREISRSRRVSKRVSTRISISDALSTVVALCEPSPSLVGSAPAQENLASSVGRGGARRRAGRPAKPVVEFPPAKTTHWLDPCEFSDALTLHMERHDDSTKHLAKALTVGGFPTNWTTIRSWLHSEKCPRSADSLAALDFLDRRYRLPLGYFRSKLPMSDRSPSAKKLPGITAAERRRLAWHLPHDFDRRPLHEREAILEWVQRVVITGTTEYRQFQAAAMKHPYAIRFPEFQSKKLRRARAAVDEEAVGADLDPDLSGTVTDAPAGLAAEMAQLVRFKTSTLTSFGLQRSGVWGEETASQRIEHFGLMFGALAAAPSGAVRGFGVPLENLTFGLLVFPIVWDWYVQWRERRRGFFTRWESEMLALGLSFTRKDTGWIRQHPALADRLRPIPNLITETDIAKARGDWEGACDVFQKHAHARVREINRVVRVHRDPFEPILAVLEAESPVREYLKIPAEILRLMPDTKRYPMAAAEAVRSFLMIRLGLHLGLRQKNLRQLLVCPRGQAPATERQLEDAKRGELRWSERERGWEVFIPACAFKNATSSYFGSKPFRLVLPDLGNLYHYIDAYIDRHRKVLLRGASDPRTFFVKSVKAKTADPAYCQNTFYEAWRQTIQRYGIYNPYTERGAIKGLLPHGPHNVRDVLATHILKVTGSYEQASYAIQDTPEMVASHYGRFLPQDKAALAAQILNRVWEAA
ncbi:hypothetical protein [Xanthobacter sp. 91]|uniref:hypothetical protein n=1 Tax=Xanthobacter sp. 91 TaxID=1117244 RepID=UPI00049865E2|nr:hypothetical protein [Xanthobacter sp. 91]